MSKRTNYRNGDEVTLACGCDGCSPVRINGVLCHEKGCSEAWRDGIECRECGCDFCPDERYQVLCNDCLEPEEYQQEDDFAEEDDEDEYDY